MDIWKVEIEALPTDPFSTHRTTYAYTGTATSSEIAIRAANRCAKKDGLIMRTVKTVEHIGEKEFGRR